MAVVGVLLAAPPALGATPNEHNCAGVFASRFADGQMISELARAFDGLSEFVLPDANCGKARPERRAAPR